MAFERCVIPSTGEVVLSGEVNMPVEPVAAVVITHPHPLHGGSMYTPVPSALMERATSLHMAALRFDFRGVGASTGRHDHGVAERDDVRAAVTWLRAAVGEDKAAEIPMLLAGWSFGADVSLAVDDGIDGWFAVAAPLAVVDPAEMVASSSGSPKLLLVPEHDQFRPPDGARSITADWTATMIEVVPGADHFLAGALHEVTEAFERFVGGL